MHSGAVDSPGSSPGHPLLESRASLSVSLKKCHLIWEPGLEQETWFVIPGRLRKTCLNLSRQRG